VQPASYLFIAARVIGRTDYEATVGFAHTAAQVMDGVGLFCFGPAKPGPGVDYVTYPVPTELALDRVLYRACQDLIGMRERPVEPPSPETTSARRTQAVLEPAETE
jgi:hypothetical protein